MDGPSPGLPYLDNEQVNSMRMLNAQDMGDCLTDPISCTCRVKSFSSFYLADSSVWQAGWLTLRTMSISGAFAFATSVAARTDSIHTATHQVCLQVWLAASLLADALAVAAQSLIARYLSSNDQQVSVSFFLESPARAYLACSKSSGQFQLQEEGAFWPAMVRP